MCGIAGYIGKREFDKSVIDRTLGLMNNRGPDHQEHLKISLQERNIYLFHSRLNIIDLHERSNQPISSGPVTMIYNGEVYNYVEVRKELEKAGVTFKTTSDTEVVLESYLHWGKDAFEKFEGMFAFAVYDKRDQSVLLARDKFGEKPLYYFETDDGLYFGSEIKYIQSLYHQKLEINYSHLYRYLVYGYKSLYKTDEFYFKGIQYVPSGGMIHVNAEMNLTSESYWKPSVTIREMSLSDAIEGSREKLLESVRLRLRADVPLAFCLSGGVDSAAIVSIAAKEFNADVATYSIIDKDERYNEYENIKATLDDIGCKNTMIHLEQEGFYERLEDLIAYHDVPLVTISYLVHSLLSERIAKDGYRVVFSGTSADELFTGYYDHFILHLYEMRNHPDYRKYVFDWEEHIKPMVRNPHLRNPDLYAENPNFRDHVYFKSNEFKEILKTDFSEEYNEATYTDSLLRNRMLNELFHEATPVILREDDLNSMKYSIENRSPYLDSKLFEFAYSIPNEYLIKEGYGKYVLREAMKGILNDQVRLDRRKKGFNASINSVIDFSNPKERERLLDDSPVFDIIEKKKIEEIITQNPLPNSYSKFLFSFLNVKIFLEKFN